MSKRVIVWLLCVLMLSSLTGCKSAGEMISDGAEYIQEAASGVDPVSDVKRISFPEQLGNDATIGEMVDLVLYDTEWISDKTGEDTYYVQVQGTIEEDIPDYRKAGNEICILAFNVKYIGNAVSIEEDPSGSYWPTTSTSYSPIYHLNAAYKIAAGITPSNLIWDDNKDTTNPNLPIYKGSTASTGQSSTVSGSNTSQTATAPSQNQSSDADIEAVQEARYDAMHAMFVGTWKSYQGGEDTDDDGILEFYEEYEVTLILNDNGTGSVVSYGNTLTFTWESGSTMTGDAVGRWDDFEDGSDYLPVSFDIQMVDDNTITADLSGDGGTWIVYFHK